MARQSTRKQYWFLRIADRVRLKTFVQGDGLAVFATILGGSSVAAVVTNHGHWRVYTGIFLVAVCLGAWRSRLRWEERADAKISEFESKFEKLETKRQEAAKFILGLKGTKSSSRELRAVLDFFQHLGRSLRKGEVRDTDVYAKFGTGIQYYWEATYSFIIERQTGDQRDIWGDVYPLYHRIIQERGLKTLTEPQCKSFFRSEAGELEVPAEI